MKTRKKRGVAVLAAGFVMLLSATLLFCANRAEDRNAGEQAERLMMALQASVTNTGSQPAYAPVASPSGEALPAGDENFVSSPKDPGHPSNKDAAQSLPYGNDCIGFLQLPTLGIELPVLSEWSYENLRIAPCRQFGSSHTSDLVIAAHNYRSHFGRLGKLREGETISFTDSKGKVFLYSVEAVRTISPTEVDAVKHSGSDLVLYTCTYGGEKRVAVFCSLCVPAETVSS